MAGLIEQIHQFTKSIETAQWGYSFSGGRKFVLDNNNKVCFKKLLGHREDLLIHALNQRACFNNQENYDIINSLIKCKSRLLELHIKSDDGFFNNVDKDCLAYLNNRILYVWIKFIRIFSGSWRELSNDSEVRKHEQELSCTYASLVDQIGQKNYQVENCYKLQHGNQIALNNALFQYNKDLQEMTGQEAKVEIEQKYRERVSQIQENHRKLRTILSKQGQYTALLHNRIRYHRIELKYKPISEVIRWFFGY